MAEGSGRIQSRSVRDRTGQSANYSRAPNGDIFVAETKPGDIRIFRGMTKDGKPEQMAVFASGLNEPFGIAFYPPGPFRSGSI